MLSFFLRTIPSSPRVLCSPKPYLSRENSIPSKSFGRVMNQNRCRRGGTGLRWRAKNSPSRVESTHHRRNEGSSISASATSTDRSSETPLQNPPSSDNVVNNISKHTHFSPVTRLSREWRSSGAKDRSSRIGGQHVSTSIERETDHKSSELPKCLPIVGSLPVLLGNADFPTMIQGPQLGRTLPDLVVGHQSSEHHKPLPVSDSPNQQNGHSWLAYSGSTDTPSKNEIIQLSSPGSGVSNYSSEHPEALHTGVPFDICKIKAGIPIKLKPPLHVKNREKRKELDCSVNNSQHNLLGPGMVLLKNYISLNDQIKIVKTCQKLGLGIGGFYQPGYTDGAKLRLHMMCLGKNWEPEMKYVERRLIDDAEAPAIPDDFKILVKQAIEASHNIIKHDSKVSNAEEVLPWMCPDICIVNFYSTSGKLGLHQDRDESPESLRKGLPVVSFSIGDRAEFLYGDDRDAEKANKVVLESGDVLIFGGKSRHIFHGIPSIVPDSAPRLLVEGTDLRPGRLNLTFRQY